MIVLGKPAWTLRLLVACGSLLLSVACHKKATVPVPVAAPAAAVPVRVPTPVPAPAPPPVAATPAPQPAVPTTPSKPSPFPPATAVKPTPVPAKPAPALGAILTADQRRKLDAEYQSDLRQTNDVLNTIRGRALTPSQTDSVNRARAFIRQAAQYHDRDVTTAAELARRARVLTQDLAGAH
jgi:hypothetical protein